MKKILGLILTTVIWDTIKSFDFEGQVLPLSNFQVKIRNF